MPHFTIIAFQTGAFGWGLWQPSNGGRAILACAHGYISEADAMTAMDEFKRVVRDASLAKAVQK